MAPAMALMYLSMASSTSTFYLPMTSLPRIQMTGLFSLYDNKLSFAIPTQLGNMVKMESEFALSYNKFTSTLPTEVTW